MATRTRVVYTDDIDGTEGARTVEFAVEGQRYTIDLADANLAALREALAPFVAAGKRLPGGRRTRGPRAGA